MSYTPRSAEQYGHVILAAAPGMTYKSPSTIGSYGEPTEVPTTAYVVQDEASSEFCSTGTSHRHFASAVWVISAIFSIMCGRMLPSAFQLLLYLTLLGYSLDLANARDALVVGLWLSAIFLTVASSSHSLLQGDDSDTNSGSMVLVLAQLSVEGMVFCASVGELCGKPGSIFSSSSCNLTHFQACFGMLQLQWIYRDASVVADTTEKALHSLLPPVASSVLCYRAVHLLKRFTNLRHVALLSPFIFAGLMAMAMHFIGNPPASHLLRRNKASSKFTVSPLSARLHSCVLLLVPGSMYILMFRHRLLNRYFSSSDICDLILVWAIPYLLHSFILMLPEESPYEMNLNWVLMRGARNGNRGCHLPTAVFLLTSIAVLQRYIAPICKHMSYEFDGHHISSAWVTSIWLTISALAASFAVWVCGAVSSKSNEPLFGEYHDDITQLSISITGLSMGRAFGVPWNFMPLPVLACVAFSVWTTTRALRYLSICLFVVHATGAVIFSYRYAAVHADISSPLGKVSLARFGMFEVFSSICIGLFAGFAVRPHGGFGASLMKRVDVPGILLVCYSILLGTLELIVLHCTKHGDLVLMDELVGNTVHEHFRYDLSTIVATSALIIVTTALTQKYKTITIKASLITFSFSMGKIVSAFIEAVETEKNSFYFFKGHFSTKDSFVTAAMASILLAVLISPSFLLKPIFLKTGSRHMRSVRSGKLVGAVPTSAHRTIAIFSLLALPLTLLLSTTAVVTPVASALSTQFIGDRYYDIEQTYSSTLGFAMALWGLGSSIMLNHYLPNGGASSWRKASVTVLLIGCCIVYMAPAVPSYRNPNQYAYFGSVSNDRLRFDKQGYRGLGFLSATVATLLALTGPLDLRERRHPSGNKDRLFFCRVMLFSLLFSSGVSVYLTSQVMENEVPVVLIITTLLCAMVSFFATVACVLGYLLDLGDFDEVNQMAKAWLAVSAFSGVLAYVCGFFSSESCLPVLLVTEALGGLALGICLRFRSKRNSASRALGNFGVVFSFFAFCAALYGWVGVIGLDQNMNLITISSFPLSVAGTLALSTILLLLEGEPPGTGTGQSKVFACGSNPFLCFCMNIPSFSKTSRFAPVVTAILIIFLGSSLYTILLRGCFLASSLGTTFPSHTTKGMEALRSLAEKSHSQSRGAVMASSLARNSFWTAANPAVPFMNLVGLAINLPGVHLILSHFWYGQRITRCHLSAVIPLSSITALACRGIPSLAAISIITLVSLFLQWGRQ